MYAYIQTFCLCAVLLTCCDVTPLIRELNEIYCTVVTPNSTRKRLIVSINCLYRACHRISLQLVVPASDFSDSLQAGDRSTTAQKTHDGRQWRGLIPTYLQSFLFVKDCREGGRRQIDRARGKSPVPVGLSSVPQHGDCCCEHLKWYDYCSRQRTHRCPDVAPSIRARTNKFYKSFLPYCLKNFT